MLKRRKLFVKKGENFFLKKETLKKRRKLSKREKLKEQEKT